MRVFYTGNGTEIEGSEDNGRTWKTYTKCKVVDYGGESYVWPPPGKAFEWRKLSLKHPILRSVENDRPMLITGQSIPVVVGEGEEDSFLDLTRDEMMAAFRSANAEGLMLEKDYRKSLSVETLEARAAKLMAEIASRKPVQKDSPPRVTKSRKS